jgi:tetratricopeptide (TPR) repeat protein
MPPVTTEEQNSALSLQDCEDCLEPLDTAANLNGLATVYYFEGQFQKAELFFKRALATHEKALGAEHPNVARSLNNLGLLYTDQRQYAKAEPLYLLALAILNKTLGAEHPDVAVCLDNYVTLLKKIGRTGEAAALAYRTRAIREQEFDSLCPVPPQGAPR